MGLAPDAWGPSFWSTIHLLCIGAPKEIPEMLQLQYIAFFHTLPYILPCGTCAQHLRENYKKLPIENFVSSQELLFRWSVLLHNEVNSRLQKKLWSEQEAKEHWTKKINGGSWVGNSSTKKGVLSLNWKMFLTIILLSILAGIAIVSAIRYYKKNKQ